MMLGAYGLAATASLFSGHPLVAIGFAPRAGGFLVYVLIGA
jgi:hypothetical protein